jgi:ElaB/YqjD/DUF883 family membrane-anchored ribosome-binding protein
MGQWDEHSGSGTRHGSNGGEHGAPAAGAEGMISDEQREQLEAAMENAKAQVDHYVEAAATFIRERPVVAIAGALAIGYIVGKLASRR